MSLPLQTLSFYRMADQTPAAATLAAVLDCIYAALGASTDYRGTSLDSTHVWTSVTRYQNAGTTEAVYASAPSGSPMTLTPKVLFAGAATAGSSTFQTDSFTASAIMAGIAKNAGAYSAWNSTTPFTSGSWAGFNKAAGTAINSTSATVRVYVSQEVILVDVWASATAHYVFAIGAMVEAFTDDPSALESDSRLYGCLTTGSTGAIGSGFLTATGFLDHSTSNGGPHMWVYQPGSSGTYNCGRATRPQASSVAGNEVDMASVYVGVPIVIARSSATNSQNGKPLGRLREIYTLGSVQSARTLRNGSTDLFHVVGYDSSANGDALALKAAA